MENNRDDPLVLPSGPITRSCAKRYGAAMSLYVQDQVTLELQDHSYARCEIELEEAPKFTMVLEACKEAAH
ncbi:hypothetical protein JCGZ_19443 [Jatropha curcas]|uniref:Uncharacterized protein n=1 Tax=Jatropha curcas TaxID=180498 RepID=A0A067KAJ9_JATCU|nr:hypothetical protein JCGZ_19443 [Jatropha curcas]